MIKRNSREISKSRRRIRKKTNKPMDLVKKILRSLTVLEINQMKMSRIMMVLKSQMRTRRLKISTQWIHNRRVTTAIVKERGSLSKKGRERRVSMRLLDSQRKKRWCGLTLLPILHPIQHALITTVNLYILTLCQG